MLLLLDLARTVQSTENCTTGLVTLLLPLPLPLFWCTTGLVTLAPPPSHSSGAGQPTHAPDRRVGNGSRTVIAVQGGRQLPAQGEGGRRQSSGSLCGFGVWGWRMAPGNTWLWGFGA